VTSSQFLLTKALASILRRNGTDAAKFRCKLCNKKYLH
jgi:hypothetical protein